MRKKRRRFSKEFKLGLLHEIEMGKPVVRAAREHEIHPNLIHKWLALYEKYGSDTFQGNGLSYKDEAEVAKLERKIGQLTMEIDLLKKALSRMEELRMKVNGSG